MMTYVVSPDRAKKANISSRADHPVAIRTVSEAHVLRT